MDKLEITQVNRWILYYEKLQRGKNTKQKNCKIKLLHLPSDIRKSVGIEKLHATFYYAIVRKLSFQSAWKGLELRRE